MPSVRKPCYRYPNRHIEKLLRYRNILLILSHLLKTTSVRWISPGIYGSLVHRDVKVGKGRRPIGANNGGGTSPAVCWRQSSDRFHWWDMEPVVSGFLSSVHSRDECLKFCHDMLSMFGATSSVKLIRNCCHCIFGTLHIRETQYG